MSTAKSMICKGCWQHMHVPIPIRGPLSIPFKLFGIKASRMNPNLCTICETMFTKVKHRKQMIIPATIFFADLRGYTNLSQGTAAEEVVGMLHHFYDECAAAVWDRDGIVNKFIGDAVLAIFNFPIMREDHVRQAVLAATELQRKCSEQKRLMVTSGEGKECPVGVGIGIHTGLASIGEVGTAYKDFTIIGPVVNMASRVQGAAQPGEILVTEEVYGQVADLFPAAASRSYQLKGIENPVKAYRINMAGFN
jgi:class 3 adenylate cyclase